MTRKSDADYENVFERIADQNQSLLPMINGINSHAKALEAHQAAHEYDASKKEKEAIASKLKAYNE